MTRLDDPLHDREVGVRDSTLDTTRIDDVRIGAVRPLITPALLQERVPVRDETLAIVESSRVAVADVLHISTKTVEAATGRIFSKLGLESDADDHRRVRAVLAYLNATSEH